MRRRVENALKHPRKHHVTPLNSKTQQTQIARRGDGSIFRHVSRVFRFAASPASSTQSITLRSSCMNLRPGGGLGHPYGARSLLRADVSNNTS